MRYRFRLPIDKRRYDRATDELGKISYAQFKRNLAAAVLRDIKADWPVRTGRSKRAMRVRIEGNILIVSNRWDYVKYVEEDRGIIHRVVRFHLARVRRLA